MRVVRLPLGAPAEPEHSDEDLMAAVRIGDRAAMSLLFRRHHLALERFCLRLTGTRGDLEDLVQSTFLAAWSHAASFRGQASVRAWLYGIAANLHRRAVRSERRRRSFLERFERKRTPNVVAIDDEVARKQLLERLSTALEELPHDLRVIFVMCEIEDISGTEAARVLGIRPGTAWRRLHDARKRLLPLIDRGASR